MFFGTTFDMDTSIPSLQGKTIIVTGGSNGLGKEAARRFAQHGARVIVAARNQAKSQAAIDEIKAESSTADVSFLQIDLASLASVDAAAQRFLDNSDRLDILMNNGGIMAVPEELTEDGYEVQFGVNHMGHALLTKRLLPLMLKTTELPNSDVRIVNLTSVAQEWFSPKSGPLLDEVKTTMAAHGPLGRYGNSKLSNVFYTKALATHYPQIKSVAVHPGGAKTGLGEVALATAPMWQRVMLQTSSYFFPDVSTAVRTQVWASIAPREEVKQGAVYYPFAKEHKGRALINDHAQAERLWTWTERELTEKGY
jgi:NAD(P)-dependent dehydrogenase (short-subunit alcohol dehydrogenase family)